MTIMKLALATLAAVTITASAAVARSHLHHHAQVRHLAHTGTAQPYGGNRQAGVIALATERAQTEPGVTNELAPDSRQTATGGPVGGVPGYDGM